MHTAFPAAKILAKSTNRGRESQVERMSGDTAQQMEPGQAEVWDLARPGGGLGPTVRPMEPDRAEVWGLLLGRWSRVGWRSGVTSAISTCHVRVHVRHHILRDAMVDAPFARHGTN